MRRKTLGEKLARLVSLSGFSLNAILKCQYLVESFERDGTPMPSSANTIRDKILAFASEKQVEVTEALSNENFLSICCDEWTGLNNKRYLNIVVHSPKQYFNLGLIEIKGSANSFNLKNLIEIKLRNFGISFEKIVSICSDGASVMMKCASQLEAIHTICFLHTIHLTICDVLYSSVIIPNESESESESEYDEYESEECDNEECIRVQEFKIDYVYIIHKVRKVVKFFKSSPKRSEILETVIAQNDPNERTKRLQLDSKTRWSSLYLMLECFMRLLPSIKIALISLKSDIEIFSDDVVTINNLIDCLRPFYESVLHLSKLKANQLDTASTINFIRKSLNVLKSDLSSNLISSFNKRILSRIDQGLLNFVQVIINQTLCINDKMKNDTLIFAKKIGEKFLDTPVNILIDGVEIEPKVKKFSIENEMLELITYFIIFDEF